VASDICDGPAISTPPTVTVSSDVDGSASAAFFFGATAR